MFHSPEQAIRFAFKIRHKTIVSQAHNVFIGKDKIRSQCLLKVYASVRKKWELQITRRGKYAEKYWML